jgi:hypothetical protein
MHQLCPYGKTKGDLKFQNAGALSRTIGKKNVDKYSFPTVNAKPAATNVANSCCLLKTIKDSDK